MEIQRRVLLPTISFLSFRCLGTGIVLRLGLFGLGKVTIAPIDLLIVLHAKPPGTSFTRMVRSGAPQAQELHHNAKSIFFIINQLVTSGFYLMESAVIMSVLQNLGVVQEITR